MLAGEHLTIGDTELEVVFNARARFMFEGLSGYTVESLRAFNEKRFSDQEAVWLLVAGLEGARVRNKSRRKPWTVDEVVDGLLGDATPSQVVGSLTACLRAVNAAYAGLDGGSSEGPADEGKATPTG